MITRCNKCRLSSTRKKIVNGQGSTRARIALVGEAPGEREDLIGRPFVGRAGKLLDAAIEKNGMKREALFITNIVKCRPPGNRKPKSDEISACHSHLINELKKVKPEIIMALGSVAVNALLKSPMRMRDIIGRKIELEIDNFSAIIIPNYHPAAAMRNRKIRRDFEKIFAKVLTENVRKRT